MKSEISITEMRFLNVCLVHSYVYGMWHRIFVQCVLLYFSQNVNFPVIVHAWHMDIPSNFCSFATGEKEI